MRILRLFCFCLMCFASFDAKAFSVLTRKEDTNTQVLRVVSFPDYFPFGYTSYDSRNSLIFNSVFIDTLREYISLKDYRIEGMPFETLGKSLSALRENGADVFVGAYYASSDFNQLEFVFPAVLINPVHLMTTPDKIQKLHKLDDLKAMKGIYNKEEHLADYVREKLKEMNVEPVSSADEAYRQILTGEADFLLGSYYYNYGKTVEMGLKDYVSFSTQALWNMPMFIAISKEMKNAKAVHELFRRLVANPDFAENMKKNMKKLMKEKEENSQGVVPPMYVRQAQENELTPADELLREAN